MTEDDNAPTVGVVGQVATCLGCLVLLVGAGAIVVLGFIGIVRLGWWLWEF